MTMKNITLSAEKRIIELAREKAKKSKRSLNSVFREWLARYVDHKNKAKRDYESIMKKLSYVKAGRRFSREEMNER